jgi:hypothetical protein
MIISLGLRNWNGIDVLVMMMIVRIKVCCFYNGNWIGFGKEMLLMTPWMDDWEERQKVES